MKDQYIWFVDYTLPDGTAVEGGVGGPKESAVWYAEELRKEHPDWVVDLRPINRATL